MVIDFEVTYFADRWINKTLGNPEENIENLMDRYISFFIAFNALYQQIAIQEYNNPKYGDKSAATKYTMDYIGADQYLESIIKDNSAKNSLDQIIEILKGDQFCISIEKNGYLDKIADHELANKLNSNDNVKIAFAILTFLYQVRCNIFHGAKSFEDKQIIVLRPANTLLQKTVNFLMQTIKDRIAIK